MYVYSIRYLKSYLVEDGLVVVKSVDIFFYPDSFLYAELVDKKNNRFFIRFFIFGFIHLLI